MKKPFIAQALLVLSLLLPTMASATPFSRIVAFGDSLTDTGNLFELTGSLFPPSPPYFEGRFSNGPLWIEYLSDDLSLPVDNFAVGGAKTGHDNRFDDLVPFVEFPGLLDQIEDFEERNPSADPNALYAIWAGADNFLPPDLPENPSTAIAEAVDDLTTSISTLTLLGAQQFLLLNLPDLGLIPRAPDLKADSTPTNAKTIDYGSDNFTSAGAVIVAAHKKHHREGIHGHQTRASAISAFPGLEPGDPFPTVCHAGPVSGVRAGRA